MTEQEVFEKNCQKFWLSRIESQLLLPYSWSTHQYLLFILREIKDIEKRLELRRRIFQNFTDGTNGKGENKNASV